jgi:hypothetical protein
MSKAVTVGATALLGCILCATPVTLRLSPEGKVSLSIESASAVDALGGHGECLAWVTMVQTTTRIHRQAERRNSGFVLA